MKTLALVVVVCFAAVAAGCASFASSTTYHVRPLGDGTQASLQCKQSSSGSCHFQVLERGGPKQWWYVVAEGSALQVGIPVSGVEICAYASKSKLPPCKPQVLGPGGAFVSSSVS